MGTVKASGKTINVIDLGVIEGAAVSATVRGNNAQRLTYYAAHGYSLYFPGGVYEINAAIEWSGDDNVSVTGAGAHIVNYGDGEKTLSFSTCNNVVVDGLKITGPYRANRSGTTSGYDKETESHIYCNQCDDVRIINNVCIGSSSHTISVSNAQNVYISGNACYDGQWDATNNDSADIFIGLGCEDITITDNRCCSNTLLGIEALQPHRNTVVSDNTIITMDANREELTTAATTLRKAGIELSYTTSTHDELTSEYEMIISDNKIANCRWSGISLQNSGLNPGGTSPERTDHSSAPRPPSASMSSS